MSDLISKKFIQDALIEKISNLNAEGATRTAKELIRLKKFVDGLTPYADRPTGEWISEELANMICNEICYYKEVTVDADRLNDLCEGCLIKKRFVDGLTPTDAIEVIRCKDCKWYDGKSKGCNRSGGLTMYPLYEYDYCSYGERREL